MTENGELTSEEIREIARQIDESITLTCGACGGVSPFSAWCETPVAGELPASEYQCPKCRHAYRRELRTDGKPWEPAFQLTPIDPCL